MERIFGWSDFGGKKMVGFTYFLPWPTIFQLLQIGEKMGRKSDLIKITFYSPKVNSTLTIYIYIFSFAAFFFSFYGFFV